MTVRSRWEIVYEQFLIMVPIMALVGPVGMVIQTVRVAKITIATVH